MLSSVLEWFSYNPNQILFFIVWLILNLLILEFVLKKEFKFKKAIKIANLLMLIGYGLLYPLSILNLDMRVSKVNKISFHSQNYLEESDPNNYCCKLQANNYITSSGESGIIYECDHVKLFALPNEKGEQGRFMLGCKTPGLPKGKIVTLISDEMNTWMFDFTDDGKTMIMKDCPMKDKP